MKKDISELEVLEIMFEYENKKISEIDAFSLDKSSKSYIGLVIEKSIFGLNQNSKPKADLEDLNIEIKTTPVIKKGNRFVSKERLVLNLINYCNENWDDFYESSFWKKNQNLLIIFYEYVKNLPKEEQRIVKSILYKYPEHDFRIILNDWFIIAEKVINGKAHEISERDTVYLAACTKGVNKLSMQNQPFSNIKAKQRAYSLKPSYMSTIFNDYVLMKKTNEKIIKKDDFINIGNFDLEDFVHNIFEPYLNKSIERLIKELKVDTKIETKSINSLIVNKILDINNDINDIDEFKKAGIKPKTIRVGPNRRVKEHMSLPAFKFVDIVNENWEDSELYNLLVNQKFLFIVFSYDSDIDSYKLDKIKFWNLSTDDIEECRVVWERTKSIVSKGVIIEKVKSKTINNLPKQVESRIMHVRPHAKNAADVYELPDGRFLTKQSFWLNNNYIEESISYSKK